MQCYFAVFPVLTVAMDRYHVPIDPMLAIFAAYALLSWRLVPKVQHAEIRVAPPKAANNSERPSATTENIRCFIRPAQMTIRGGISKRAIAQITPSMRAQLTNSSELRRTSRPYGKNFV